MLHDALLPYAGRLVLAGYGVACLGPVSHYLGVAAAAIERYDDAERHLGDAVMTSRALGAAPFEVRAKLSLAEMFGRRGAKGDATRAQSLAGEAREAAARLGLIALSGGLDDSTAKA